jgi:hypothetical protein
MSLYNDSNGVIGYLNRAILGWSKAIIGLAARGGCGHPQFLRVADYLTEKELLLFYF